MIKLRHREVMEFAQGQWDISTRAEILNSDSLVPEKSPYSLPMYLLNTFLHS